MTAESQALTFGSILECFGSLSAVVVGDVMLDEYIYGEVTRISPEAPVMVVRQQTLKHVPGGAANVAANIVALGAKVDMVGLIGDDPQGEILLESLEASGISSRHLYSSPKRSTTTKTRVVANHSHQVLRIDRESDESLFPDEEHALYQKFLDSIGSANLILLSDYAKGCLSKPFVQQMIGKAQQEGKPVIANPKPGTAHQYKGAHMISLNRIEASALLGIKKIGRSDAEKAAMQIKQALNVRSVVVTLGAEGMATAFDGGTAYEPAIKVEVYDEAGAGDTAIAALALCHGAGFDGKASLALATRLAGAVVRKVGVAVPGPEDLDLVRNELVL